MMNAATTLSFPFGERKALISIDSNCSRHMTGYYSLMQTKPCTVYVGGAFEKQTPGVGKVLGTMQVGDLRFKNTVFVPGI